MNRIDIAIIEKVTQTKCGGSSGLSALLHSFDLTNAFAMWTGNTFFLLIPELTRSVWPFIIRSLRKRQLDKLFSLNFNLCFPLAWQSFITSLYFRQDSWMDTKIAIPIIMQIK